MLEAYLVPSNPWIEALATWLVPNRLSSTKFCQLIRSDRKERVSFYFVQISFLYVVRIYQKYLWHSDRGFCGSRHAMLLSLSLSLTAETIDWRESLRAREFAIFTRGTHVRNILASFYVHFHNSKGLKAAMDAFLRGQSSAKQKHQASEETAGTSSKRTIVPWVEK